MDAENNGKCAPSASSSSSDCDTESAQPPCKKRCLDLDSLDVVKALAEHDLCGDTSLICALRRGLLDLGALLIKMGADVNERNEKGRSAMYYALKADADGCVDLLLKRGADLNVPDRWNYTLLHHEHILTSEHVKKLVAHGADINRCLPLRPKPGRDLENDHARAPKTPLQRALDLWNTEVICALLDLGAETSGLQLHSVRQLFFKTPGVAQAVKKLLAAGADMRLHKPDGCVHPVVYSAEAANPAILNVFLKHSFGDRQAVLDKALETLLCTTARDRDQECLKALLKAGAQVNAFLQNVDTLMTPLHYAVLTKASADRLACLLDAGADPRLRDPLGNTVFDYAAVCPETLERLRQAVLKPRPGDCTKAAR